MPPGVAVATSAVLTMVRPGVSTATVAVQAAFRPPAGQVLPAAADTAVFVITFPPVSGLFTVTE